MYMVIFMAFFDHMLQKSYRNWKLEHSFWDVFLKREIELKTALGIFVACLFFHYFWFI